MNPAPRRRATLFTALALTVACTAGWGALRPGAALADDVEAGHLTGTFAAADARELRLSIPVGTVEVVAGDRSDVRVDLSVRCGEGSLERGRRAAARLRLRPSRHEGRLTVAVEGYRKLLPDGIALEGVIEVPRTLPLQVRMDVGELRVRGAEQALDLGLGVGEVDVSMARDRVREVDVHLGVGEATLRDGERILADLASVFGNGLRWRDGRGPVPVAVRLGVGEANLRLD
jgi:hypothetical protein